MSGIIRRVDGAGRVVIPMSIRRKLDVREGSSIEFAVKGNVILFRKCSSFQNFDKVKPFVETLYKWSITLVMCYEKTVVYAPIKSPYVQFCSQPLSSLTNECESNQQPVRIVEIFHDGESCQLVFIGKQSAFERTVVDYISTLLNE